MQQKKVKKNLKIDVFKINNITAEEVSANRTTIRECKVGGINISGEQIQLNHDTRIRIGNFSITMAEFENLMKFNRRLIQKCGASFGYCQIIQKYDINSQAVQQSKT